LVIHAETADAADFYRRISPSFEASPTDPLDLIFLTKDLRTAIREAERASFKAVLGSMPDIGHDRCRQPLA